ncbi:MAG: GAF domain-containing protein [Acidobacteria bacterium]|nr:GAF domain-containing protein [Acidobacteriota bacterium]
MERNDGLAVLLQTYIQGQANPHRVGCPTVPTLEAFLHGQLKPDVAESLHDHLRRCRECLLELKILRDIAHEGRGTASFEALASLIRSLTLVTDTARICHLAIEAIAEMFEVEKCAILLHDPAHRELVCQPQARGLAVEGIRIPLGEGTFTQLFWESGEPFIADNLASDLRCREYWELGEAMGIRSFLAHRLQVGQQPIGVVIIADKISGETFNPFDAALLDVFIEPVANALVSARTLQAQTEEKRRCQTVSHAASLLHAILDLKEVLERTVSIMLILSGADRCHLVLHETGGAMTPALSIAKFEAEQRWKVLDPRETAWLQWLNEHWQSLATDRAIAIESVSASFLIPSYWSSLSRVQSLAVVPLTAGDQRLGFLMLEYTEAIHGFSGEEIGFIEALARQSALAIKNAQAFQQAQSQSKE